MSEVRRALIVGNSDYQDNALRGLVSPRRDTEELARVLTDPAIGGFQVSILLNEKAAVVSQAIEEFFIFSDAKPDDLLLLYFSGHGITDEDGLLYLATADTQLVRQSVRRSSAVAAEFVDSTMRRSRARRQILLLDCCHSGAFAEGMRIKGDPLPALDTHFKAVQGKGRVVLTASSPTQFAFEGSGRQDQPSVYTQILVRGLETGEADLRGDGQVDLDELHEYVLEQLASVAPHQTPTKSGYLEGKLYIARTRTVRAAELPQSLRAALSASEAWMRQGAITELDTLLRGGHAGLALAARQALVDLRENDDSLRVRAAAAKCLGTLDPEVKAQAAAAAAVKPMVAPEPAAAPIPEPKPVGTAAVQPPGTPAVVPAPTPLPEPKPVATAPVARPKAEPAPPARDARAPGTKALLALLAIGVVNRMVVSGRGVLAAEFHFSYSQSTLLYIIAFALGSLAAGSAVARYGTRRAVTIGLLLSGGAGLWAVGVRDPAAVLICLIPLGLGLATVAPAFCAIFAQFDLRLRALANSLYVCIYQIATPLFAVGVVATVGWRVNSLLGAVTAIVLAIWWWFADRRGRPPQGLPSRTKLALYCCVAYFAYSYCLADTFRTFLRISSRNALPNIVEGLSAMISGLLLYRIIGSNGRRGLLLCKRLAVGGLLLAGLCGIAVLMYRGAEAELLFGVGVCAGLGAAAPSLWTLVQSVGSPASAAKWGGVQALIGVLVSVSTPSVVGIPGCMLALAAAAAMAFLFDTEELAAA